MTAQAPKPKPVPTVTLPLDCRKSGIQSGIPVRRNSDGRITRVDVCGAADSPVDNFRDIPYEPQCETYNDENGNYQGQLCH